MRYLFLMLMSLSLASDCLNPNQYIDIRTSRSLRAAAEYARSHYGVPMQYSQNKLYCIPKPRLPSKGSSALTTAPKTHSYHTFLRPEMISNGVEFYRKNRDTLNRSDISTDPFIITSIIGIESQYGNFIGRHKALHALGNIVSEDNPNKQHRLHPYMSKQLAGLLYAGYKGYLDLDTLISSWDGGIGLAQFMPEPYLQDALSASNKIPDLFKPSDAILSINNYFAKRGKWRNGPIATQIDPSTEIVSLLESSRELKCTPSLCPDPNNDNPQKIYKIGITNGEYEYWMIYPNFMNIMTYNPRISYGIAVTKLADTLRETYANTQ